MEENKLRLYESTKEMIFRVIKKVMRENPKLTNEEDIRELTEIITILQLTNQDDASDISDETEKEIEYRMQVFNKAFAEAYKQYINEEKNKENEKFKDCISTEVEEDLEI